MEAVGVNGDETLSHRVDGKQGLLEAYLLLF